MAVGVKGNYFLRLKFGENLVPLDPSVINEFTIIQDMNKFLPSFRISLSDSSGSVTHTTPSDKNVTDVRVEIGKNAEKEPDNSFDFSVFRKFPTNEAAVASIYDISGLLDTAETLFAPNYCRSFTTKTVKQILEDIALNELGCDTVDVSPSLAYVKMVVQPDWSNAMLINDLKQRLIGTNDESNFRCIIRRLNQKTEFIFKSIGELCEFQQPVARYVVADEPYEDYLPVFDYEIFDNYKMLRIFGSKKQEYQYFDYYNTEFVTSEEVYSDVYSLSKYFLIDSNDPETSDNMSDFGVNNDFTRDYKGNVRSSYHARIMSLVKMWITVWGNPDIAPGHLILLLFAQGLQTGSPESYQYSGYWLVEKVVHSFGDTFRTKLLITRNGIDTNLDTTLLVAGKKKE